MAKTADLFPSIATALCFAVVATVVTARSHVTNCLDDADYDWHANHYSLDCTVNANPESGVINYYAKPYLSSLVEQQKGPWVNFFASTMHSSEGSQFLRGSAFDYNGNHAPLRYLSDDGKVMFQNIFYVLATDADCELKKPGYETPTEKLNPSELCRIKNK